MALSTPAKKEAARLKKQQRWNEDRAYARENDPDFVKRENAATQKSNTFAKNAKAFAREHLAVFQDWLKGTAVAPSATQPSPMDAQPVETTAPTVLTADQLSELSADEVLRYRLGLPAAERIDTYKALNSDHMPTSDWLERKRMNGARDAFEKKWNIELN
jgi:hypothetical protein